MARDPVCGMMVDKKKAADKTEYRGMTYYFCSTACRDNFARNPDKYLGTRTGMGHGHGCCG